jgi:hypothetical protein
MELFPRRFSWNKTFAIASKIKSRARRTFVEHALATLHDSIKAGKHHRADRIRDSPAH